MLKLHLLALVFAVAVVVAKDIYDVALDSDKFINVLKKRWNFGCVSDNEYGCHKGYCWSYCAGFGQMTVVSLFARDWCYTGPSYSQSFKYGRCSSKADCNPRWKCAGSCTA